jgi:hypothetical protein
MSRQLVFLVPGFFDFSSVGSVSYSQDVEQALARAGSWLPSGAAFTREAFDATWEAVAAGIANAAHASR